MFEKHHIVRRLKLNLGANSFGYVVAILHQVALVPIYLSFWPKILYGEWLVLSALPLYLGMTDLGLGSVASKRMTIAMGKGDVERATVFLHTTWVIQTAGLFSIFLLTVLAICVGQPAHWLGIDHLPDSTVKWCLLLLTARTLLLCQTGIYRAIYDSNLLAAHGFVMAHSARFLELVVIAVGVPLGMGVVRLSAMLLVSQVGLIVYMYWDSRRRCGRFRMGWSHFSRAEVKSCLRDGVASQMILSSNLFIIQGMTLMVNFALGPVAVVVYNTTRVVCRACILGIQMLSSSAGSELSLLYGRGDLSNLSRIFQAMVQLVFWFSLLSALGFFLIGGKVIALLTHGKVLVQSGFLLAFAIGVVTTGFWMAICCLLVAINQHRRIAVVIFALSVFMLPLSWLFMRAGGKMGAPLAIVATDLVICAFAWWNVRRLFPDHKELSFGSLFRFPDVQRYLRTLLSKHPEKNDEAKQRVTDRERTPL